MYVLNPHPVKGGTKLWNVKYFNIKTKMIRLNLADSSKHIVPRTADNLCSEMYSVCLRLNYPLFDAKKGLVHLSRRHLAFSVSANFTVGMCFISSI